MKSNFYYLIHLQYLGYRYHGWAKQPNVKTVQLMLERTITFVLNHARFKTLGASRTDAMVSALEGVFEIFIDEPIDLETFKDEMNANLPPDIKILNITQTDGSFNIIQSPKLKEYLYLFSFGEKFHPFCAPILAMFHAHLDIHLMKEGALLFEGTHNFKNYVKKPSEGVDFTREIILSRIEDNTSITASFFPSNTYIYRIQSKGFMRNQIRLMMGRLVSLGAGEISLDDIRQSLNEPNDEPLTFMAPASGLILNKTIFDPSDQ